MSNKNSKYSLAQPKATESHATTPATDESPRAQGVSPVTSATTISQPPVPTPYDTTDAAVRRIVELEVAMLNNMALLTTQCDTLGKSFAQRGTSVNQYLADVKALQAEAAKAVSFAVSEDVVANIARRIADEHASRLQAAERAAESALRAAVHHEVSALNAATAAATARERQMTATAQRLTTSFESEARDYAICRVYFRGNRFWWLTLYCLVGFCSTVVLVCKDLVPSLWHWLCSLFT